MRERHDRGHAERHDVIGIGNRETRRIGAGRGIGLRGELAQLGGKAALGIRPEFHTGNRLARLAKPSLRQRNQRFLLAAMGEPHHALPDGHDLTGLRHGRGDHAIGVGLELRIGKLIACQIKCALRPLQPAVGLILGGLLAIVVGNRRIAALAQRAIAQLVGRGLRDA
jgi:hypothetical protein